MCLKLGHRALKATDEPPRNTCEKHVPLVHLSYRDILFFVVLSYCKSRESSAYRYWEILFHRGTFSTVFLTTGSLWRLCYQCDQLALDGKDVCKDHNYTQCTVDGCGLPAVWYWLPYCKNHLPQRWLDCQWFNDCCFAEKPSNGFFVAEAMGAKPLDGLVIWVGWACQRRLGRFRPRIQFSLSFLMFVWYFCLLFADFLHEVKRLKKWALAWGRIAKGSLVGRRQSEVPSIVVFMLRQKSPWRKWEIRLSRQGSWNSVKACIFDSSLLQL